MGYFFCPGNYAHEIIERANTVQTWGTEEKNPKGVFGLRPGNSVHSYIMSGIDNNDSMRCGGIAPLPSPTGSGTVNPITLAGNMGGGIYPKIETSIRAAQCVITTQTVGEWKRSLTNLLVSPDGFTGVTDFEFNGPIIANNSGRSYVKTTANGGNDNTIDGTSIYNTTIYDDYLICKNIYYYDESKNPVSNVYNCMNGQVSPYRYFDGVFNVWKTATTSDINLNLTPDVVIYGNYNKNTGGEYLGNCSRISRVGGSTTGIVDAPITLSSVAPYTVLYLIRPNTTAAYTGGGLMNGWWLTRAFHAYIFPDFRAIQTWYLDWGIQAFETVGDLQNDLFPDDLEPDLGFDDNQNPSDIDFLPDNKGDPTEFTQPDLLPESTYDLYALNYSNYVDFKKKIITKDFWENILQFFNNPLDSILSITLFPFDFLTHDSASLSQTNSVDIVNYSVSDIPCYKVLPKYSFYNFNLGACNIRAYYGNYLDYQANYVLYVPFCGTLSLDPSLVVNHTIYLRCAISALSGEGTVYVTNESNRFLGMLSGNFGTTLTFTSNNFSSTLANALFNAIPKSLASVANPTFLLQTGLSFTKDIYMTPKHTELHGQISGNAAYGGVTTSFIQVTLPIPTQPSNYEQIEGINSQYYTTIASLPSNTFVLFEDIFINIPCTEAEKDIIYTMLTSGIII